MSEIQFASVKDAVRWAEEMATVPDVGSCLGNLTSHGLAAGRLSYSEMKDVAFTVSLITSNARPWKGMALKAVYGCREKSRDHLLGVALASKLMGSDYGKRKMNYQLMSLGIVTVKATRAKLLYGDRFHVKRMAEDVGVSRQQFITAAGWKALRAQAIDVLNDWVAQGTSEVYAELVDREWMS